MSQPQQERVIGGRVDFHTHILPGVDDGSSCVEQSMQMIRALHADGVDCIALTPHFYPRRDNPERFIQRRDRALGALLEAIDLAQDMPRVDLVTGAEIEYFDGISCMAEYPELKFGESGCLLVEMPPETWSARVVDDLLTLNAHSGCRVVIAHVERYLFEQRRAVIYELLDNGILMQSNAEFFADRRTAGKAVRLFKKGYIHLLGTDAHNMSGRAPNMGAACEVIKKRLGDDALDHIMNRARRLLCSER